MIVISTSCCEQLANIISGVVVQTEPACAVMRLRNNIPATILGRRTKSSLAIPFMVSVEKNGLNLGETVALEKEINPLICAFQRRGITVTAFHNHWLYDKPKLMYVHWVNVGMDPVTFVTNSYEAAKEARIF